MNSRGPMSLPFFAIITALVSTFPGNFVSVNPLKIYFGLLTYICSPILANYGQSITNLIGIKFAKNKFSQWDHPYIISAKIIDFNTHTLRDREF